MKKSLLLTLLAVVFGISTAAATVTATINVDNAANVVVTNGMYGTTVDLIDGMNRVDLDETAQPLVINAAEGARIVSVSRNGEPCSAANNGYYTLEISQGMYVQIETSGSAGPVDVTYNVWFEVSPVGSFEVVYGETVVPVDKVDYFQFPGNTDLVLRPADGFKIINVNYAPSTFDPNKAVDNGDGTWTVNITNDRAYVLVTVEEIGVKFNVDVNLASNISLVATYLKYDEATKKDVELTKTLSLAGNGPYSAIAPLRTQSLDFLAAEGAVINSVSRTDIDDNTSVVANNPYVGYRSEVTEGDLFTVDATGPEVKVTLEIGRGDVTIDKMVASVNGKVVTIGADGVLTARAGDILTVSGGRGAQLTGTYADRNALSPIVGSGDVQSFKVIKDGTLYLYTAAFTERRINVDNAAAVVVKDKNGYGDAIALTNGANTIVSVENPLSISPAEEYEIASVVLDGVTLEAKADGSYSAALEEGSTLSITTRELPKALPVTISVIGDYTKLSVAVEGEPVTLVGETTMIPVLPGKRVSVAVAEGWLIDNISDSNKNNVKLNEETGEYTVTVKNPSMISVIVKEWVAAEGNALVRFSSNSPRVSAYKLDADGNGAGSIGSISEVKIGTKVRVQNFDSSTVFSFIKVNGTEIDLAADARMADITINGETTIEAETYRRQIATVTGYKSYDPDNHSTIGYIYVNEEGQLSTEVQPGTTVTLIPYAEPGYKFTGFSLVYPETVQLPAEAPYTFVAEADVTYLFEGTFVRDDEKPSYLVRGNNTLMALPNSDEMQIAAVTRIYNEDDPDAPLSEKIAYAGETVHLLCYVNDIFGDLGYTCQNFTLFNDNSRVIPQDYVVDPADVVYDGVIEVAAILSRSDAIHTIECLGGGIDFDRATATIHASAPVRVFSISGALVLDSPNGVASLESLPSAIYVVTSGNAAVKVAR